MIDIGTIEKVPCTKVCQQSPLQLCKLAAQALSCSLKDAAKVPLLPPLSLMLLTYFPPLLLHFPSLNVGVIVVYGDLKSIKVTNIVFPAA